MNGYRIVTGGLLTSLVASLLFAPINAARAQASSAVAAREVPDNVAPHPAPSQPLPYSHKTHLALGLTCETCHTNPAPKAQMTFPATGTCMTCHAAIATDRDSIVQLKKYADSGEVVPWNRVYSVLQGVTWSHEPHLTAGVQCGSCHGDVAQLETMSETTAVTAMASCISCHESRNAPTGCATCHAWPQP